MLCVRARGHEKIVSAGAYNAAMLLFAGGWIFSGANGLAALFYGVPGRWGNQPRLRLGTAARVAFSAVSALLTAALIGVSVAAGRFGKDMGIGAIQDCFAQTGCATFVMMLLVKHVSALREDRKRRRSSEDPGAPGK